MTSQVEEENFEKKLLELQKKFGEEKRAHGETILQLLSSQAQVQTAEARAAKAQELVAETTLKLDQARDEIMSLRAHAHEAQSQAGEAQARIKVLETQVAQTTFEAAQDRAQELENAEAKIASLEAVIAKARAVFAESEEPQDQKLQMTQLTVVERIQTQELLVAQCQPKDLKSEVAQKSRAQELVVAQNKIKDLEAMGESEPNPDQLTASCCWGMMRSCPWFGPKHLQYFAGNRLELGKCDLKVEDMVQFLDSWLAGSHPILETLILRDIPSQPTDFDKYASSLVRRYKNGTWYESSTFFLERTSDGRIACVTIARNKFIFVVE